MTRAELESTLKEILGIEHLSRMIESQITNFIQNGYTSKNIARSVYFYIVVRKNEYNSQYGIGIVPHVHDDAVRYFNRLSREEKHLSTQREILLESLKEERKTISVVPKVGRRGIVSIDISKIGEKEVE